MRRFAALLAVIILLSGCSPKADSVERGMALRKRIAEGEGCAFIAQIVADLGEEQHIFEMECSTNGEETLTFQVLTPDTISGITGSVDDTSGKLTFDDTVLSFPLLAEGLIPPVIAPWLVCRALTGGYLRSCGQDADGLRMTIDDLFQGENLQVDIWLNEDNTPIYAQIFWEERCILSVLLKDFRIL